MDDFICNKLKCRGFSESQNTILYVKKYYNDLTLSVNALVGLRCYNPECDLFCQYFKPTTLL